ncbi:MAG: four helix bundle protein [Syntrophobacterales bacterium]|nr:four helix bundle protein [Syntrophobacterales bacterium]
MKIEQFEDIEAWQLARELTRKVYRLTKKPGFTKDYGLNRQIQDETFAKRPLSPNFCVRLKI